MITSCWADIEREMIDPWVREAMNETRLVDAPCDEPTGHTSGLCAYHQQTILPKGEG